ncbi:MAG: bifunctional diaminohydroxyphosphoribosylaminopyrimidine deaminase/5-amino-6-(5-phosphoribosylamino)uracil reductase RibD [Clostridium sp.]|nr:bifunctional diaminohydroxyphosphoribosylaminopyrimidine deaminase/5-amino-6-(5-phosphoribosylamino)uracil reductase RibD [Clostridium sp.]MCM1398388.1 bifunctional diaminohydroxyphosphoribosylaminopyrimidine deaminase/5-amino-6-(5-phosphoribosylamino)uracil reductase RibD [Clostridium sp.]MCM1458947.1 bifunctional diaminohydroxyphosphoribosylaminopyrimidine deaminase/5-amino-6-(5-phosphoribosylamino)uracil reductase RibD [Bacteroides sp.]
MFEEKYMQMAIELAKKGKGAVNPNPLVGAVIVKEGKIIGQGYHARYGELHAERAAFSNLTEDAEGAELYVTLEPCCHFGKQPPCVHAIAEHKIAHVYVGSDDPNEKVAGKGIQYLREHGVEVDTHMLKEQCDELNQVFFHYITTKRPYVAMKYAMTLDGKIATYNKESKWITCKASRMRVAESRNEYMGIMAGIGTVLADNPMLTCRIEGGRNPIRIICDSNLRIPIDCNIVNSARDVQTIVAIANPDCRDEQLSVKMEILKNKGVEILEAGGEDKKIDLRLLTGLLGERGIDGILLEGGGTLNYSAIQADIVNEIQAYIAPKIFGGKDALSPVEGQGVKSPALAGTFCLKKVERIEDDILLTYRK